MNQLEATKAFVRMIHEGEWRGDKADKAAVQYASAKLLHAAGFLGTTVVPGMLRGDYLDQDGSRSGETYPINVLFPYKVQRDGNDHYLATGWLDCACTLVKHNIHSAETAEVDAMLLVQVRDSNPLDPIIISAVGDELHEDSPSGFGVQYKYFVKHTRDEDVIKNPVGIHGYCRGYMDRTGATATHHALVCRSCHIRILYPNHIQTYGELRQEFLGQFAKKE